MASSSGFTLIEFLVVLAMVSAIVLVGIWFAPNAAERDARQLASAIEASRLRAVAAGEMAELGCAAAPPWPGSLHLTATPSWPSRGLLFTPDGLPRTCDGGGVGNTTILLEHRGRQAAVIVSALGRVRWELR